MTPIVFITTDGGLVNLAHIQRFKATPLNFGADGCGVAVYVAGCEDPHLASINGDTHFDTIDEAQTALAALLQQINTIQGQQA